MVRPFRGVMLGFLVVIGSVDLARASDDDDESPETKSKLPNIYLDYSTAYTTVPPNTLAIGFRSFVSPIPAQRRS